jgi:hypothetical protein
VSGGVDVKVGVVGDGDNVRVSVVCGENEWWRWCWC